MKYKDVKDKIKDYFKNINPEDLYRLAIQCGFKLIDKDKKESKKENKK